MIAATKLKNMAQQQKRRSQDHAGDTKGDDAPGGVCTSRIDKPLCESRSDRRGRATQAVSTFDICVALKQVLGTSAAIVASVVLALSVGGSEHPVRAESAPTSTPRAAPQSPGLASDIAWKFRESPLAGGPGTIPRVTYVGTPDRGFGMSAECRGSGPSIYISIENPDAHLQRLKFDVPIPVTFRIGRRGSPTTATNIVRPTALLTGGYTVASNRVVIGMARQEAASVVGLIESSPETSNGILMVELMGTPATFDLTGARQIFATFKSACLAKAL